MDDLRQRASPILLLVKEPVPASKTESTPGFFLAIDQNSIQKHLSIFGLYMPSQR